MRSGIAAAQLNLDIAAYFTRRRQAVGAQRRIQLPLG
jgi:hypothetical protein